MIKHLSSCEEKIIESLAWQSNSTLWSHLKQIKLNTPTTPATTSSTSYNTQLDIAFPLYDDVNIVSSQYMPQSLTQYHVHHHHNHHPKITTTIQSSSTNSIVNTADFLNTNSSVSSPIKQAPTITRVVCNNIVDASSSPLKSNTQTLSQQILTNNNNGSSQQTPSVPPPRLKNVSKFVACFFRKFYALANTRVRTLIEKLELAQGSIDLFNQNRNVINYFSHFFTINYLKLKWFCDTFKSAKIIFLDCP